MSRSRLQSALSVAFAFLLITSMMPAPAAAADGDVWDGAECSARGSLEFAAGLVGVDVVGCETPGEDVAEGKANIYGRSQAVEGEMNQANTAASNQAGALRSQVWALGKAKAIESLKNGNSMSETKSIVNATVEDQYSAVERSVIAGHNDALRHYEDMIVAGENVSVTYGDGDLVQYGVGVETYVGFDHPGGDEQVQSWADSPIDQSGRVQKEVKNYTLANGNTTEIVVYNDTDPDYDQMDIDPTQFDESSSAGVLAIGRPDFSLNDHSGSLDDGDSDGVSDEAVRYYSEQSTRDSLKTLDNESAAAKQELNTYVEDLYAEYSAEDFDDTDAVEAHSAASFGEISTDQTRTGSYARARAAAAMGGYNGTVNESFEITYTPSSGETVAVGLDTSSTLSDRTVSNPTLGNESLVHGNVNRQYAVDISGVDHNDTAATLEIVANGTTYTERLKDPDGDGRYQAPIETIVEQISDGESADVTVVLDDGSTVTNHDMGAWTINHNGGNSVPIKGGLFTDWEPSSTNGSFEVNTQYDTANAGSTVYFAHTEGDGGVIALEGTFEIDQMTNVRTGDEVTSVELEDRAADSADPGLTKEELQTILDLREQTNENFGAVLSGGGGGGIGSLGGIGTAMLIGLVAAGFLVFRDAL